MWTMLSPVSSQSTGITLSLANAPWRNFCRFRKGSSCWLFTSSLCSKIPNNDSALAASRQYATKPHLAGTPQDLVTAQDVLTLFQQEFELPAHKSPPIFQAGSAASRLSTLTIPVTSHPRTWIDTYYPVLNTPLDRHLQVLDSDGNVSWEADLEEVADDEDPEAGKYFAAVPTFHGLSKDGDVKGKLVYANYGRQEDYKRLLDRGKSNLF